MPTPDEEYFPPPGPLKVRGDLAQNWKAWRQIWKAYKVIADLGETPTTYRVAMFVTCLGQDALKIYNSLQFSNPESKINMTTILTLMERHCVGEANVIYDPYVFNRRDQTEHESSETYLTNVESLSTAVLLVQWRVNFYVPGLCVVSVIAVRVNSCFRRKHSHCPVALICVELVK